MKKQLLALANCILIYTCVLITNIGVAQNPGALDFSFVNQGTGTVAQGALLPGQVAATAVQNDGKIIIGGQFVGNAYQPGTSCLVRVKADGSIDSSFLSLADASFGVGTDGSTHTINIQTDGKIIVGGGSYGISRLNTDGTADTSFHPVNATGIVVRASALQNDGKIVIGGGVVKNGTAPGLISRLNINGTVDTSFHIGIGTNAGVNDNAFTVSIQNDGKIIVGGVFTKYNGTTVNRIVRLNSDGTIDNSFSVSTAIINNTTLVYASRVQSNGTIIIGGTFIKGIAFLNSDGSLDNSFNIGSGFTGGQVNAISMQNDGKIVVGGDFSKFNGTNIKGLARLNTDGTLDASFNVGTGTIGVLTTAIQPDGKIIVGGAITAYNGTSLNYIARVFGSCNTQTINNPQIICCLSPLIDWTNY